MKLNDIDPELQYCPACGDEYRPEIRICAGCGGALELGRSILEAAHADEAVDGGAATIGPDETVVNLRKGPMLQIKALQLYLRSRGLPAQIVTEDGGGCGCRGPEVVLQVRDHDLQQVMVVLAEEYRQSTGLDDHDTRYVDSVIDDRAEEALCPACGFRFSTRETTCPDCGLCFG